MPKYVAFAFGSDASDMLGSFPTDNITFDRLLALFNQVVSADQDGWTEEMKDELDQVVSFWILTPESAELVDFLSHTESWSDDQIRQTWRVCNRLAKKLAVMTVTR